MRLIGTIMRQATPLSLDSSRFCWSLQGAATPLQDSHINNKVSQIHITSNEVLIQT